MRPATVDDIPLLVELMREFYAEAGYPLDGERYAGVFRALLADDRLGRAYVIEDAGAPVGHVVLTIAFAMEFGGPRGIVDDFYVRPAHRNRGHGRRALVALAELARGLGLLALTVEVGRDNGAGQAAYRHAGFAPAAGREVMILEL